jgi:putative nucleotidyltransferase with HDIG domain
LDREAIRLSVRQIRDLPTLPVVVSRVLEAANNTETTAIELGEIVAQDVSVSAKVLSLANSAFYGFSRRITTIQQAVVVLGFDTVRSLALSVSVFDTLSQNTAPGSFDREAFWIHSIACGTASRLIAKTLRLPDQETYFVAGLFHDLGKIILDTYFHDRYIEVCQELERDPRPTYLIEKELLEIDHAEVGGLLSARWKFPEILVTPIACHHSLMPVKKQFLPITLAVHLADFLIKKSDLGLVYEKDTPDTSSLLKAHLKISSEQLKTVHQRLVDERDRIFEFMNSLAA